MGSRNARTRRAGRRPGAPRRTGRPQDLVRRTAFEVIRAVQTRDAYANLLLPVRLRERGLTGRDAALATELTYGTLRGRGTYDAVLEVCSDRPLRRIDEPLLDVLRLGAHQLLGTRIPPHAAVGTAVELARSVVGAGRAGFANAVLRKVATRDLKAWLDIVAPPDDELGRLSVTYSHPRWIVSALRDALGPARDEIEALLAADNDRPRVTLVAKPGRATVAELVEAGAEPAAWSPQAAVLPEGDPAAIEAVAAGRAAVQDEASQLVTLALAAVPLDGPDGRWLDMCAGPGGKAGLLSGLAGGRGARLLACDLQEHRAALVRQAVDDRTAVAVADGTAPPWRPASFDRVLLDAPCTGLGALRRRPEARWRRDPSALAELGPLQRALLAAALEAVRPGGVVAYVTCSPHLAETRVVVDDVLRDRPDVQRLDAPAVLAETARGELTGLGEGPYAQFWPHRHGTDAMFLALLRRTG
ncbi:MULTISPECIES: RsmB/NOP family class I SAM-dependent RNA methyltransferase [Thermomonospora]|uniref:Fmu (Sun) domain protein n=1 Tax=Thermomonospora curvata (strain ATCC 19995 / DSM 43183 / JCM 3096 / KCTC 9072 / NBRC 15933 / NCIMB 10081 / Henssen B9) TaxID=471852 RepID=D1A819_THECD|nr:MULTISPECIES: transcription antitermination factor NusB [Thermomonospora]ACY98541.1 Fmu (Sun) domain protein [Thermomonospora curvata DSM 43183]PKK13681.1 MAG: rRNA cytosine-C5-methyltransferase [Thermomonospora sp. CIF 1]